MRGRVERSNSRAALQKWPGKWKDAAGLSLNQVQAG
jgi:hypothetical protein